MGGCAGASYHASNVISFILAFASASSVAVWAIWDSVPWLWFGIIGFSQMLHVARPYLPYIKHERDFVEMGLEFELLYMKYEKLWYEYDEGALEKAQAEKLFYQLREKEIEIESNHKSMHCPEIKWLSDKAHKKMTSALKLNFIS